MCNVCGSSDVGGWLLTVGSGVAFCFHVFRFAGGAILFLSPFFHSLQVSLSLSLSLTHTHTHTYKVSDLIYTYSLPENNSAF